MQNRTSKSKKGSRAKDFNAGAVGEDEIHSEQIDVNLDQPQGSEAQLSPNVEKSEGTSIPPGFEGIIPTKVSSDKKGSALKRHIDLIERRVTRSKTKQSKELAGRSRSNLVRNVSVKEGKEYSPQESDPEKTIDSMRKLAEESLKVGEMLGIKVIANKENAVKRITQTLKISRASRSTRLIN